MMEFHVLTPRGSVHLLSVDCGRIVSDTPHLGDPLTARSGATSTVAPPGGLLQDHSADNTE